MNTTFLALGPTEHPGSVNTGLVGAEAGCALIAMGRRNQYRLQPPATSDYADQNRAGKRLYWVFSFRKISARRSQVEGEE